MSKVKEDLTVTLPNGSKHEKNATVWNFSNCDIGPAQAIKVGDLIQSNPKLLKLNLSSKIILCD